MPVQVVAVDRSTEMVGSVFEGVQEKSISEVPHEVPTHPTPNPTQFATNLHNSQTWKQLLNCLCQSYQQNHRCYFHAIASTNEIMYEFLSIFF